MLFELESPALYCSCRLTGPPNSNSVTGINSPHFSNYSNILTGLKYWCIFVLV